MITVIIVFVNLFFVKKSRTRAKAQVRRLGRTRIIFLLLPVIIMQHVDIVCKINTGYFLKITGEIAAPFIRSYFPLVNL